MTADDDESRRPFCRGVDRARAGPAPQQLAQRRRPRRLPARATASPASPASTPAASPATSATRARCPARSARPTRPTLKAAAAGRARHRRRRPRRRGHHAPSRTRSATGPRRVVAYDFGIKRTILRHLVRPRHRRGRAGVDARRRRARPRSPTACSSPTAPATRRRSPYAVDAIRGLLGEVPVFGICLGHQLLGRGPRRPTRASCRSATTAATTRCAASPPARSRSPARTTTSRSPPTRSPAAEVTHVNLNDGVIEGLRCLEAPRLQRAVPPRGRPGPARRRATCSTEFADLMERDR